MYAREPFRRVSLVTAHRSRKHDVDSATVSQMSYGSGCIFYNMSLLSLQRESSRHLLPHTVSDRLLTPKLNIFQACTQLKPFSFSDPISNSPLYTCTSAPVPVPHAGCSCLLQAHEPSLKSVGPGVLFPSVCPAPLCLGRLPAIRHINASAVQGMNIHAKQDK